VYSSLQLAAKYFQYYLTASNGSGHGTHSPFIFEFISKVLKDRQQYPAYNKIELLRKALLKDPAILEVEDYGAGSSVDKANQRSVSSIAKHAAKPPKYGQLLFRMVQYYNPHTILELGTSLGITTAYLSVANPVAELITIEGSPDIASKAKKNFQTLGLQNILVVEGNFDTELSQIVSPLSSIDLAFIDGNHRREPTENYFAQLLPKINNDSILVFDDIHWSRDMEQAWATIKDHPATRASIDLFFMGIVIFRREFIEKQHFVIRF
jgi:predicted O-methyltransferase YrrM